MIIILFDLFLIKQQDENENKEPPSLSELFIETQKKKAREDLQGIL